MSQQEICGLMVATLGEVPLAVNSVLLSFSSILFQVPSSGGNAAANRIGNLLGANQPMEASLASKVAMSLAVLASAFNR
jgi:MATE family multidrug resistance protein